MDHNSLHNESVLLSLVATGDQRAFTQIVTFYTPVVYKHLLIYIKNAQRAEELTQDVFISIWRNREKLPGMENFAGYLYVTTRNKIHMAFREKLHATEEPPEDILQTFFVRPDAAIELKELHVALERGIDLLPARRKQVFTLSRMGHKTYEEIASELQISKSAVKQHIIEALVFLRTYLRDELGIAIPVLVWLLV